MDLDFLLRSQPLVIFIVGMVLAAMGWAFRQHLTQLIEKSMQQLASKSAVEALSVRVDAHSERLMTMEATVRHLPTAEQVNALTVSIAQLRGEVMAVGKKVDGVDAQMQSLARRIDLIDHHLRGDSP